MNIAQRIRIARKLKGWSQARLAEELNLSRGSCSQWERNVTSPSVENLSKLALLLNVHFEWLATGRGQREYQSLNEVSDRTTNYINDSQISSLFQLLPNDLQDCMLDLLKIQNELINKSVK